MNRRRFLGAVGAAGLALAGDAFGLEPQRIDVTRHRMGTDAPPLLRLVQLTDLHLKGVGDHERAVATTVRTLEPDLVLLTGDSLDQRGNLDVLRRFLDLLPEVPPLAILGNWERWVRIEPTRMAPLFRNRGGWLLVNEKLDGVHRGAPFAIVGLDDWVGGTPDVAAAGIGPDTAPRRLLLQHCPGWHEAADPAGFDAVLSGHTHGGQVRLPGWAPIRPRGSGPYLEGWYRDGASPLYVSRGVGTTGVDARLFCPPEIAVFEWGLG